MLRTKKGPICILLAAGFDEYDVVTIARSLRRCGLRVMLVGLTAGPIRGSYGISIMTDKTLSEIEAEQPLAVVLPGGIHGIRQLNGDPRVHNLLRRATERGGYLVAVDAGNLVLRTAGILNDLETMLTGEANGTLENLGLDEHVIVDGHLVWGCDAEAADESAATLVSLLQGCGITSGATRRSRSLMSRKE